MTFFLNKKKNLYFIFCHPIHMHQNDLTMILHAEYNKRWLIFYIIVVIYNEQVQCVNEARKKIGS